MKKLLIICLSFVAGASGALAQNQLSPAENQIVTSVSPGELVLILQSGDLNARYMGEDGGSHTVEVNQSGSVVYFALRDCAGIGQQARCALVQPFGFFDAAGVTLSQINDFNLNRSLFSYSALTNDSRGIVATKIYMQAGVSSQHLLFSLGLYFLDLDTLLSAIIPGSIAEISYDAADRKVGAASKLSNAKAISDLSAFVADRERFRTNRTGENAPSFLNDAFRAYLD